jgi:hypothetical protein
MNEDLKAFVEAFDVEFCEIQDLLRKGRYTPADSAKLALHILAEVAEEKRNNKIVTAIGEFAKTVSLAGFVALPPCDEQKAKEPPIAYSSSAPAPRNDYQPLDQVVDISVVADASTPKPENTP